MSHISHSTGSRCKRVATEIFGSRWDDPGKENQAEHLQLGLEPVAGSCSKLQKISTCLVLISEVSARGCNTVRIGHEEGARKAGIGGPFKLLLQRLVRAGREAKTSPATRLSSLLPSMSEKDGLKASTGFVYKPIMKRGHPQPSAEYTSVRY